MSLEKKHSAVPHSAFSEIDLEGVIEPDTDEPQEMGDPDNVEVKRTPGQICKQTCISVMKMKCVCVRAPSLR